MKRVKVGGMATRCSSSQTEVDANAFRAAMRHFVGSVSVVTTWHDGRPWGMTINSFTSICMDPPTILVCLNSKTVTAADVRDFGRFAVNLLSQDQRHLSELCSRPNGDKYVDEHVLPAERVLGANGIPKVRDASVVFTCRTVEQLIVGSHLVAIAAIESIDAPSRRPPLLYGHGRYMHSIDLEVRA
ncbi:flavin reductase family protein [Bradyrhizobium sp. 41S5]|uniref:flavin reductase family protein n=1 Tax=Bradyrhizobium sp. 41S5 TaxID=1404443 RepID=UPI00156B996A|nr:flavin reductase family protein [Bradyrhizobium sp. 41S5]UFX47584.1 flavin reductase family protein [Bradyrhizobium sp. 41S5]